MSVPGVAYQVYVRSFADSDGDGIGDLAGVRSRLGYVRSLGVEALWLSPVQVSPQVDHGYDVADYTDVDPLFGDLTGLDALVADAHRAGMAVLLDLVPNHCSDRHPLFLEALASPRGSAARRMFHFRPGTGPGGVRPPNDWTSVFGGPAWSRVPGSDGDPGEWYLHLYTPHQPDWNWADPRVADLFDGVLRFWLDRGVDGFRVDVAHGLVKRAGYPDLGRVVEAMDGLRSNEHVCDLEGVHDIYRRWRGVVEEYTPPRCLVGEVNLPAERSWRYTRPGELDQVFTFPLWRLGWDPQSWCRELAAARQVTARTGAPVGWALENHDLPRAATRFGGGVRGRRRSLAMTTFLLGLPGSVYLYQGQELALLSAEVPVEQRQDPAAPGGVGLGRDAARVPLPWRRGGPSLGFSETGVTWLPQPDEWATVSVEAQSGDPGSPLEVVRRAVAARGAIRAEDEVRFTCKDGLLTAARPGVRIVLTMGAGTFRCDPADVIFSGIPVGAEGLVPPDVCVWLRE